MLQILIGNAHYNCSCVLRYTTPEDDESRNRWPIIPLAVAAGILLIIVIIAIIVGIATKQGKCRSRPREDVTAFAGEGQAEIQPDDRLYYNMPPGAEAAYEVPVEPEDKKGYMALGRPQSSHEA